MLDTDSSFWYNYVMTKYSYQIPGIPSLEIDGFSVEFLSMVATNTITHNIDGYIFFIDGAPHTNKEFLEKINATNPPI